MLPGMLLHVVEAPGPVDGALDFILRERLGEQVKHPVFLIDDVLNRESRNASKVVRLSAGAGVEGGPVEDYTASIDAPLNHASAEGLAVGIGIIEPLRYIIHWRYWTAFRHRNTDLTYLRR